MILLRIFSSPVWIFISFSRSRQIHQIHTQPHQHNLKQFSGSDETRLSSWAIDWSLQISSNVHKTIGQRALILSICFVINNSMSESFTSSPPADIASSASSSDSSTLAYFSINPILHKHQNNFYLPTLPISSQLTVRQILSNLLSLQLPPVMPFIITLFKMSCGYQFEFDKIKINTIIDFCLRKLCCWQFQQTQPWR